MSWELASESPLEHWPSWGERLGVDLWVKRDDLLPFPLAGNKVRKLAAESAASGWRPGDAVLSSGGIDSNHCRTLALMAARLGIQAHLVLHGNPDGHGSISARILAMAGATFDIGPSDSIGTRISAAQERLQSAGRRVFVVGGGAHTPAGVSAYEAAGRHVLKAMPHASHIVMASGTGATQAGLAIAAARASGRATVLGISVARSQERGVAAIRQAIEWVAPGESVPINFDDRFIDGGYGRFSMATLDVVQSAWALGMPLDPVYTGKAAVGMEQLVSTGLIPKGSSVIFWHTGGLMNQLTSVVPEQE